MSGLDPHSLPNGKAQTPPPPLTPPMVASRGKDSSMRSHREGRIQRSLESMTVRHTRADVQQLIFRYLQQSGYLRSAMSFAYECMLSSGQPQRRGWSVRHQLAANATTDHRRFLHAGPSFSQLMQQQMDQPALENSNDTSTPTTSITKESWEKFMGGPGVDGSAVAASIASALYNNNDRQLYSKKNAAASEAVFETPYSSAAMESFSTSLSTSTHQSYPSRRQAHRGSSPLGTILLLVVLYVLLRLGSMK